MAFHTLKPFWPTGKPPTWQVQEPPSGLLGPDKSRRRPGRLGPNSPAAVRALVGSWQSRRQLGLSA